MALETLELNTVQKEAAHSVIFAFDGHDEVSAKSWNREFVHADLAGFLVSEEYVSTYGVQKACQLRLGRMFLDMRATASPDRIDGFLKTHCSKAVAPKYLSLHATAGPRSLEIAVNTVAKDEHDNFKTEIVLSSVPSTMSEEECIRVYGMDTQEIFERHVHMGREAGIKYVISSIEEVAITPLDMINVITGVQRTKDQRISRHARPCRIREAVQQSTIHGRKILLVLGSTLMRAEDHRAATLESLDEIAGVE